MKYAYRLEREKHYARAKHLKKLGADKFAKATSPLFQKKELEWYSRTRNRLNPRTGKYTLKCGSCNLTWELLVEVGLVFGLYAADQTDPELKRLADKAVAVTSYYQAKRLPQSPKARGNVLSKRHEKPKLSTLFFPPPREVREWEGAETKMERRLRMLAAQGSLPLSRIS